jgi:hypothetical protein
VGRLELEPVVNDKEKGILFHFLNKGDVLQNKCQDGLPNIRKGILKTAQSSKD